jgi:hypothetical protein
MLKVQYECRQNGPTIFQAEYSIKVVNLGTTSIALDAVSVRYWYSTDGTGAQAGTCSSAAHPCTIAFQTPVTTHPTADQYAVISFAGGTLAPGADTGEIDVTMHGTGSYDQTNDYSYDPTTGANFTDEMNITGYVSGRLIWGTPPSGSGEAYSTTGWTATASSTAAGTADLPSSAIDGNIATRWTTGLNQMGTEFFMVDMGRALSISRVVLDDTTHTQDFPTAYTLEVSTDATNFVTEKMGLGATITDILFAQVTARYVRIRQTGMTVAGGSWWSIDELRIYP